MQQTPQLSTTNQQDWEKGAAFLKLIETDRIKKQIHSHVPAWPWELQMRSREKRAQKNDRSKNSHTLVRCTAVIPAVEKLQQEDSHVPRHSELKVRLSHNANHSIPISSCTFGVGGWKRPLTTLIKSDSRKCHANLNTWVKILRTPVKAWYGHTSFFTPSAQEAETGSSLEFTDQSAY